MIRALILFMRPAGGVVGRGAPGGDGAGRRFEAWRVKNTHHSGALVVGGWLGRFSAVTVEETLAMIVEIHQKKFV